MDRNRNPEDGLTKTFIFDENLGSIRMYRVLLRISKVLRKKIFFAEYRVTGKSSSALFNLVRIDSQ